MAVDNPSSSLASGALSIRERILRRLAEYAALVEGIPSGGVFRWDARDDAGAFPSPRIEIEPQTETSEQGLGDPGPLTCSLPVLVTVVFNADQAATVVTEATHTDWTTRLKRKLSVNRTWVTNDIRLAIDTQFRDVPGPEREGGVVAAALLLEITYRHDGDSPYQFGTAIPLVTE